MQLNGNIQNEAVSVDQVGQQIGAAADQERESPQSLQESRSARQNCRVICLCDPLADATKFARKAVR
jgi:chorismate-pyruvate lyase